MKRLPALLLAMVLVACGTRPQQPAAHPDWSYNSVVYEMNVRQYTPEGTLAAAARHLPRLRELGVDIVWLMPVYPIGVKERKGTLGSYYAISDYEAVNPEFGTLEDFDRFLAEAHRLGLRVILDWVANHTSPDARWIEERPADWYVRDSQGNTIVQYDWTDIAKLDYGNADMRAAMAAAMRFWLDRGIRFYARGGNSYELTLDFDSDWGFLVRTSTTSWAAGTKYGAPDNRTIIRFGEPFTLMSNRSADPANVQFSLPTMYHSHFWTAAFADLNYGKAAEAEQSGAFKAVTEAADKWVRMGVDGFRLDAVKHIYHNAYNDENPTFLKKFYDRMNESYKAAGGEGDFYMVGEMLDEADKAAPYYRGLPALFEFTFWYKLKWALQNGIGCYFVKDILDVQPLYAQYRSDYIEATKLSNHDEDRTGSDLGQSAEKMKVAAAVLLTAQGAPYIYQGEELGYWGTKSNGDEYVRTPILWDKAGNELASGSLSGKIDMQMLTPAISVEAQADDDGSLLNLYRTFARLRNTYPVLAQGKMVKHPVYNDGNTSQQSIAAWYRELDGERMLVVHNFGREEQILTLTDQPDKAVGVSGEVKLQRGDASSKLLMGAWSSVVFTL